MTQTRRDRAHLAVVTTQSLSDAAMLAWTCCLLLVSDSLLYCGCWAGPPPTVQRPDALVASQRPQGCHQCRPTSEKHEMLAPWADHGPSGTNVLAMLSKESNNPK